MAFEATNFGKGTNMFNQSASVISKEDKVTAEVNAHFIKLMKEKGIAVSLATITAKTQGVDFMRNDKI